MHRIPLALGRLATVATAALLFSTQALAGTTIEINNGLAANELGYWRVPVGAAGDAFDGYLTGQGNPSGMIFQDTDIIFRYQAFVDVGALGDAVELATRATSGPTLTGTNEVTSSGSFQGAGGNTILWEAVTYIPEGFSGMLTDFTFTAQTGTLGAIRLHQYLDEDVNLGTRVVDGAKGRGDDPNDDVFYTRGDFDGRDLQLFTIDDDEAVGVSHSGSFTPAGGLSNADFAGWGACFWPSMVPEIEDGSVSISVEGSLCDTLANLAFDHPIVGPVNGPIDVVSTLAWDVNPSATVATITTTLGGVPSAPPYPVILDIEPERGPAGAVVTITGRNFVATQGSGNVYFSGTPAANIQSWSDTEIVAIVPNVPPGDYDVEITNSEDETGDPGDFEVFLGAYRQHVLTKTQFPGGGTPMGWQADDQCWRYTLPFPFPYYDEVHNQVAVCSNGFIDFASENPDFSSTTPELIARRMIAPLWDDLRTDLGGDIYIYQPTPTTLSIRWKAVRYDPANPVNVQLVLDGSDGSINFFYGDGNNPLSPTVGISEGFDRRYTLGLLSDRSDLGNAAWTRFIRLDQSCPDGDLDGYGSPGDASCPRGAATDCDDNNPDVNPGASEVLFNGIDDDCNPATPPNAGCQQSIVDGPAEGSVEAAPTARLLALLPALALVVGASRRLRRRH